MLRATVRTALAHKGRLALSTLAVVLGVAFVAGTYVFTDTLQRTFTDLFETVQPDVVVSPAPESTEGLVGGVPTLPGGLADDLAGVEGAHEVAGFVQVTGVTLIDAEGEAVGTVGPPTLGVGWLVDDAISPLSLVSGRAPEGPEQIAIDSEAFATSGFDIGDTVRVLTPGPSVEAELVGVFRFGTAGNLAGATLTAFESSRAQELLLGGDRWTSVGLLAEDGVSQEALAASVEQVLASRTDLGPVQVQTGDDARDEATAQITEGLGFITTFLLVFAGIALFVGAFIIVNTFTVLIARRTRELALLRAVGASRRQVTLSVVIEAMLVGLVGGAAGLGFGVVLATALRAAFGALGLDIPAGGLVLAPRTVLLALGIGVVLTTLAAWLPARRAGRIPPVAALREDVVLASRSLRWRTFAGLSVGALGAGVLSVGLVSDVSNAIAFVGAGLLLVFLAVALLSAVVGGAATGALGYPVARTTVGRLAVRNTQRDRRRTAATAGALMIGLALVTMIGTLGASASRSVDATISDVIRADFIISSGTFGPFSKEVGDAVAAVDGVGTVSRISVAPVGLGEQSPPPEAGPGGPGGPGGPFATIVEPRTLPDVLAFEVIDGSLDVLEAGGVAVDVETSEAQGLDVGSTVTLRWPTGPVDYPVGAVFVPAGPLTGFLVAVDEVRDVGVADQDNTLYVAASEQVDPTALRDDIEQALEPYPNVALVDQTELVAQIRGQVNQLLTLVYALLGLAVVIAVLGIVNTLLLSVLERTREIGLLRAVGTGRHQIRQVVRIEAVLIAMFGAILGVGLGLAFGVAIQVTLAGEGISELAVPWTLILAVLVVSGIVGVVSAIVPARRAANLDVLAAIATE